MEPIFLFNGPPAAGKTTLSVALMQRFKFGIHLPVDVLREWVIAGMAEPMTWNEETTRQFDLAAEGTCDIAVRYNDAGFAVAIDHCHSPIELDKMVQRRFSDRTVFRLVIAPDLETNHYHNRTRTNKPFSASVLTPAIDRLNPMYRSDSPDLDGWIRIDPTGLSISETVDQILAACSLVVKVV